MGHHDLTARRRQGSNIGTIVGACAALSVAGTFQGDEGGATTRQFPARINSEFVRCDPVLDLAANRTVQLGEHVGVQIAASGFDHGRFCYAPRVGFPNAIIGKMLRRISILVHSRVDVLHDPRLQEVESMIGHRCAP